MLENFDREDLAAIAETLPGPHAWAHGTGDIFYCSACCIAFEFGTEPVPQGLCKRLEHHPGKIKLPDW
jgi:hypothetical protein